MFGALALLVGFGALGFGLFNHLKGKRILAAPFKTTGELVKNPSTPDPKGAISTEGKVVPPAEALLAPCSQKPCIAYEVTLERLWEKTESTQEGTKTTKGSSTLETLRAGARIRLDDGSGAVTVDLSKGADFDELTEGFKKELNGRGWASQVQFGALTYDVPPIGSDDGYTIGFRATEKYAPAAGSLFVLGKLEGDSIVKPSWRSLLASAKGREGLLGALQKRKKVSLITGGVALALSIPLFVFAPSTSTSVPKPVTAERTLAKKAALSVEEADAVAARLEVTEEDDTEAKVDPTQANLADLNDVCPDTFCEGPFTFTFTELTCASATQCSLGFTARGNDKAGQYTASVTVKGFAALRSPDDLMDESFFEAVSTAISKWEERPRNVSARAARVAKVDPRLCAAALQGDVACELLVTEGHAAVDWVVTRSADVSLTATALTEGLDPRLVITDAHDRELLRVAGLREGASATATLALSPGTYRVSLDDAASTGRSARGALKLQAVGARVASSAGARRVDRDEAPVPHRDVASNDARSESRSEAPGRTRSSAGAPARSWGKNLQD